MVSRSKSIDSRFYMDMVSKWTNKIIMHSKMDCLLIIALFGWYIYWQKGNNNTIKMIFIHKIQSILKIHIKRTN